MKTVVKPTEMRADIEMTHKNVFLVLQYSVVTVSLEVPDDEDEYDYDSITEAGLLSIRLTLWVCSFMLLLMRDAVPQTRPE